MIHEEELLQYKSENNDLTHDFSELKSSSVFLPSKSQNQVTPSAQNLHSDHIAVFKNCDAFFDLVARLLVLSDADSIIKKEGKPSQKVD